MKGLSVNFFQNRFKIELMVMVIMLLAVWCGCASCPEKATVGITGISATDSALNITCSVSQKKFHLLELKPYQEYDKGQFYPVVWHGMGRSEIVIKRYECKRDRIYSKFLLVDILTKEPVGNTRYVTDFSLAKPRKIELPRPKSIKGLSCIVDVDDAIELGVKYIHENIHLDQIVAWNDPNAEAFWEFDGVQIPLNMPRVRELDRRIQQFTEAGIGVFAVFINRMPSTRNPDNPLLHPDSDVENSPTHLGAFNVTSDEGLKYYLAALEFLADRYTREDAKYGLISSIIIGNEVQQHWVWYNMGDSSSEKVIREYLIALRLGWLAAQKFHPDLRVYVSMDHHWTKRGPTMNKLHEVSGDELLKSIAAGGKIEGDFSWNVAFHPYPENLFKPRFWLDPLVKDEFSTPKITFKNIEVLPRFMKQSNMLYRGRVRDIALTEQGFHTPEGPEGEKVQAAAYAYAYYKISRIPEISAFILHRHVDNKNEGGLKLGLWNNNPVDPNPTKPWKKKYIWEVFKYADTNQWKDYFEFAKPIIGIKKWSDTPASTELTIKSVFSLDEDSVVYDFIAEFEDAEQINNLACGPKEVLRAAGWMTPAIFQHPPKNGRGQLSYLIELPQVEDNGKLSMLFETLIDGESEDGVGFSISINDEQVWTGRQQRKAPVANQIDLSSWAGEKIQLTFWVDKLENIQHDWAYWVCPVIIKENNP